MDIKSTTASLDMEKATLAVQTSELIACRARLSVFAASFSSVNPVCSAARKIGEKIADERKREQELEHKIIETAAKVSAYEELVKILPKENSSFKLRDGSEMAKVEQYLKSIGDCASLDDIVKHVCPNGDNNKKKSLRGSLRAYARADKIFAFGPQPDTYGLREFAQNEEEPASPKLSVVA